MPGDEFDAHAESYDSDLARGLSLSGEDRHYFARGRVELLKRRLSPLGFQANRILDFGCGDGSATSYLLTVPGASQVVGIDVSARSIRRAQQSFAGSNISFQTVDDHTATNVYNLVFCNGVFHHIPVEERSKAVSFVYNALAPNGIFAFWENNPWNPGTRLIMSRIPFDKGAITLTWREAARMLQAGGFSIVTTDFAFYFPRFLSLFRFMEGTLRKVPLGAQYMIVARKPGQSE